MIIDGRTAPFKLREDQQKYSAYLNFTRHALRSRDTILVNATSVEHDLVEARRRGDPSFSDRRLIPCPKPPCHIMWLEVTYPDGHFGHLVRRTDFVNANAQRLKIFADQSLIAYSTDMLDRIGGIERPTIVEVISWVGASGYVVPAGGDFVYWLNADGDFLDSRYGHFGPLPDAYRGKEDLFKQEFEVIKLNYEMICGAEYSVLHTFARMNCHNVKLVPMAAGAPKPSKKALHPPFSVWHEIVVTGLPELRRELGETAPEGEKREIRFHKIRGHYADYTKGKGLFGKYKVRIWVEEHTAGSAERGTVTSSYTVKL
jgi:hypothetical protein